MTDLLNKSDLSELANSFIDFFQIVIEKYISNIPNAYREWEYFKNLLLNSNEISRIKSYIRVLKATTDETIIKPTTNISIRQKIELRKAQTVQTIQSLENVTELLHENPNTKQAQIIPQFKETTKQIQQLTGNILAVLKSNKPILQSLQQSAQNISQQTRLRSQTGLNPRDFTSPQKFVDNQNKFDYNWKQTIPEYPQYRNFSETDSLTQKF